ncbi:MAG: HigA family addiction module antitoxin [Acidobacteriaceae bacterium]|jgi:antitoxin HigA-1
MSIPRNLDQRIPAIHPGEFLREDFMKPLGLSAKGLAAALHVSPRRISEIISERRGLDAEMILRLTRYFGMSTWFWANLQTQYDLEVAEDTIAARIRREVKPAPRDRKTGELKAALRG